MPLSILIMIFAVSCGRQDTPTTIEMAVTDDPVKNDVIEPALPHPLSIEGLRVREFSAGSIKLLKQVDAADGLEAWDFSYNSEGLELFGLIEKPAGEAPPGGWPLLFWPTVIYFHHLTPPSITTGW